MKQIKINNKWDIILPDNRADRKEWFTEKGWERKRLDSMSEHLGKGDTIFYVGAELGDLPALCELWGARTVLIEPNHTAWPIIKQIYDINGLEPLHCFAGFESDKTELTPKNPDRVLFDGQGFILRADGWPRYVEGEVKKEHGFSQLHLEADGLPQITIDHIVELGFIPTAISVDVEGSECKVLEGASKTIQKYKPKIWMSWHPEMGFGQYGVYIRNLRDQIIGYGYKEQLLEYEHELHCFYEGV